MTNKQSLSREKLIALARSRGDRLRVMTSQRDSAHERIDELGGELQDRINECILRGKQLFSCEQALDAANKKLDRASTAIDKISGYEYDDNLTTFGNACKLKIMIGGAANTLGDTDAK